MHIEIIQREYKVRKPTLLEKIFTRKCNRPSVIVTLKYEERATYHCDQYRKINPVFWAFLWVFEFIEKADKVDCQIISKSAYYGLIESKPITVTSELNGNKRILVIRRLK